MMNPEQPHQDWPMLHSTLMSNFDHEVDHTVADELRNGKVRAHYAGWNFNADCWFEDELFHAAVYRFHRYQATFSADTPEELMILVSNRYGYE